jgi:hypothetical protein
MKTAVEWLVKKLNKYELANYEVKLKIIEQAEKMFEEQIMDAHYFGYTDCRSHNMRTEEQYYNETFKIKIKK